MEKLEGNNFKNIINNFIESIDKKYKIEFAYLFGSTARAEQRIDSDIDIAIKFSENYIDIKDVLVRGELIDKGKAYFGREVDIISLDKSSTILKYEVVKDGIVIKDSVERASFESLVLREYFDFKYYSDIDS